MTNKTSSPDRFEVYILGLGFIVNLVWIILIKTQPFSDFLYYHELARQIARGGQWGDTYTTVGYSVVLGFFYKLFGAKIAIAKSINLILSVVNGLLVWKILIRMNLANDFRKMVLAFFILFPMNVYYNSILATEILFTTFLLLIIYLYLSDTPHKYWLIGLLTGLNTLIKPFFIAFFLVIFLTELIAQKKFFSSLRKGLVVLSMAVLLISPWLYRNYKLMGEFTYVSNNGGIVLYINNNSQNKHGGWMPAKNVANSLINLPEYQRANPTQKNKLLTHAALQWIKSHPQEFLILGFKRLAFTYLSGGDIYYSFHGAKIPPLVQTLLIAVSMGTIIPIYIVGIFSILAATFLIIRNKMRPPAKILELTVYKNDLFLLLIFYMFTGIYFITEGQGRYSFPVIFIIIYYFVRSLRRPNRFNNSPKGRQLRPQE